MMQVLRRANITAVAKILNANVATRNSKDFTSHIVQLNYGYSLLVRIASLTEQL